jgi:hypothetical protein
MPIATLRAPVVAGTLVAVLVSVHAARSAPPTFDPAADLERQLAETIRRIEADVLAEDPLRMGPRRDMDRIVRGAGYFFRTFPGGNGRS